ncbi:hypothetical protein BGZ46_006771 [Entomortierella lignicola]|nr:hypothetical protein BGZ46_006771 [Entomortierella lignicola]
MSKILVVFGATGQQGGSVVNFVINDPELSKQFKVRAITRDPTKEAAIALQQKGVEVVKADSDDKESLKYALQGAHTVFAVTTTTYDEHLKTREYAQGKAIVDTAVAAGVQYLIYSSLLNVTTVSGGKYKNVDQFDVKAEIEVYIRSQPLKYAFFDPGCFMQNFDNVMAPHPNGDGTYTLSNVATIQTKLPLIDIDESGKFVGAILAEPEKYEGKTFAAATALYSYEEIVETITKVSGKTVTYNQIPREVFQGFLPPGSAVRMVEMLLYFQDFGYYGAETKELVEWAAQNARGKPTTFEEFLIKNPLHLN